MIVITRNRRAKIRSFSINTHPVTVANPTSRYLEKALERSTTASRFLVDETDNMALNPHSGAFSLLWLVASLVAVGSIARNINPCFQGLLLVSRPV